MSEESIIDLVKQHQANKGSMPPAETPQAENTPKQEDTSHLRRAEAMSTNIPVDKNIQATLDALLSNVKDKMVWVEVTLPSQGILYESGVSVVKIRPFTFKEEKALKSISALSDPETLLESLLRSCVDGVRVEELTPIDRMFLLFRIRGISYGDDYKISHSCAKCGSENNLTLKISTLKTTPLDLEDMRFTLPDSEQIVEIRYPRSQDEDLYSSSEKLMDNMHRFVKSVGGVADSLILEQFVRSTTVRDIDTLRTKIFTPTYGMESEFFYGCGECGTRNQVDIELNPTFFTAS